MAQAWRHHVIRVNATFEASSPRRSDDGGTSERLRVIVWHPHTCGMTTDTGEPEVRGSIPSDTFAARLALVRHFAGRLSIEQAAAQAGINAEAWRRWEDGARPRDQIEASTAIAEAHGIDRNWLMFGGPLVPAQGKPTKRRKDVTAMYQHMAGGRPSNRPNVRSDSSRPINFPSHARRPNRVNASRAPEAGEHSVVER